MAAPIAGLTAGRPAHSSGPAGTAAVVALFVGLKLRLIGNSLKGSNARLIAGLIGSAAGIGITVTGGYLVAQLRNAAAADAYLVLVCGGSIVLIGWVLLPVLIFGIDESIDPLRFTLLPLSRKKLLAGMLAAGFIGIPAAATLLVSTATVVTWSRGVLPVLYAAAGALLATVFCVVVSRAVTTALSGVFRSRRVRDLVSMAGMLLVGSVVLLQFGLPSMAQLATREVVEQIAGVLAWTPLGAAWAAPHDAVEGSAGLGFIRLLIMAAAVVILLVAWNEAMRRSLESGGAAAGSGTRRPHGKEPGSNRLTPAWARWFLPPTVTGAVAERILRLWWRDPRQRVSLLIIPVILAGVVAGPSIAGFRDEVLVMAGPGVGTLIGLMMLNHTAYDGSALWTHLAVSLPGQVDRAGRALGTAVWALPVVGLAAGATCMVVQRPDLFPAAFGASVATVLVGLAFASVTSVVIAFPAPPASANPFITPGGGNVVVVMQQFVGGLTVGLLSLPVYLLLGFALWWRAEFGWALLIAGPVYGLLLLRLGCRIGGKYLDEHGPELLRRITPTRT
ncbi:hypothetical protein [Phytoactinopolyspora mesophila]|uniref:Transporter n=1 Tax=Phytoactinopolyspora mesophila TaxID=2650750 RepID=A0A7K3MA22_9ACTN|nr:hypothetical protein [Phytoactinopolyspora mesophila]NDL59248.1 hypothetical protein [Phytoactinopolyspora mesophila]